MCPLRKHAPGGNVFCGRPVAILDDACRSVASAGCVSLVICGTWSIRRSRCLSESGVQMPLSWLTHRPMQNSYGYVTRSERPLSARTGPLPEKSEGRCGVQPGTGGGAMGPDPLVRQRAQAHVPHEQRAQRRTQDKASYKHPWARGSAASSPLQTLMNPTGKAG